MQPNIYARYQELARQVTPDPVNIDQELVRMPGLILESNEIITDLITVRDQGDFLYKAAQASAGSKFSNPPEGQKKLSEEAIKREVLTDAECMTAWEALQIASQDVRRWQGLHAALESKASCLKQLAGLTISGWIGTNTNSVREQAGNQAVADALDETRRRRLADAREQAGYAPAKAGRAKLAE